MASLPTPRCGATIASLSVRTHAMRRLGVAISCVLLLAPAMMGPRKANALIHWHTAFEDSLYAAVDTLCVRGQFAAAIPLAEDLLDGLAEDDQAPAYKREDARRLLTYLGFAASAPESARAKLQEAHRLHARMLAAQMEGSYHPARSDGEDAVALRTEVLGPTHHLTLDSRRWHGFSLVMTGEVARALDEFRAIREIGRSVTGLDHPVYYMDLNDIAFTEARIPDREAAERDYREVVDGMRRLEGPVSRSHAFAQLQLSYTIAVRGRYAEAEAHAREARRILSECDHVDPYEWQATLTIHAQLLGLLGRIPEAREALGEAIERLRSRPGDQSRSLADLLRSQSDLLQQHGDLAEAEARAREALELARHCFPGGAEELEHFHARLAQILAARGNVLASEAIFGEVLGRRMKAHPESHRSVAGAHLNIAHAKLARNDPIQAEPHIQAADAIHRDLGLTGTCGYSVVLRKRAAVCRARGAYAEAESLLTETLTLCRRLCGKQSDWVITIHDRLANLYLETGSLDRAETHAREALRLREAASDGRHVSVATNLRVLGLVLTLKGDCEGARGYLEEALRLRLDILGDAHPATVESWCDLGIAALERGDVRAARQRLRQAEAGYEAARPRVAQSYSACLFHEAPLHEALAASCLLSGEDDAAWLAVERSRGRALAETLPPWDPSSEDAAALRDSLQAAVAALQARIEILEAAAATEGEARAALLAELRSQRENQRAALIRADLDASRQARSPARAADLLESVQQALGDDEALLGWLWLEDDRLRTPRLWGYVIRSTGGVQWVSLQPPDTRPMSEAVAGYHQQLTRRPATGDHAVGDAGRHFDRYLRPLLSGSRQVRRLVVIPSGPFADIPIESLYDRALHRWVDESYCISYAPSARVFSWLRRSAPPPAGRACLVVGDPVFASAEQVPIAGDSAAEDRRGAGRSGPWAVYDDPVLLRSAVNGNLELLRSLPRLTATRQEAERVASFHGGRAMCLTGRDASEKTLHELARSGALRRFDHIHFATHALIDYDHPDNSRLVLTQVDLPDPLEAALHGDRVYDGCLSTGEIAREWDLQCDLVTLSACDTALGRVLRGEGPVGFVQAFLQAGARNVVVSRWKVSDRATSLLMERFYSSLLATQDAADPVAITEALREARTWLRDYEDPHGHRPYAHPFYWASFVLYGTGD